MPTLIFFYVILNKLFKKYKFQLHFKHPVGGIAPDLRVSPHSKGWQSVDEHILRKGKLHKHVYATLGDFIL